MDVLIIGGTGLISTGISRGLIAEGHDVTAFHRGETDADIPDAVEHIHGNRTDYEAFESRMASVDVDCVIDMVCFTPEDAESAIRAFDGRIEQFVFCSTVDVYHRPVDSMPVTEEATREPGVSRYGKDKALCEDRFMAAHRDGAFETTILRPWETYGDHGPILHTFGGGTAYLDRIRRGKPIVVHGDGSSVWGPCHRDDVASAFVNAVGNDAAYGEAYHVTSEENMSWRRYHAKVARALDAPEPELVTIPSDVLRAVAPDRSTKLDNHYQFSTVFDNAKAARDLDFEYTIDWETGVSQTVAWLDEHDRIEDSDDEPFDDRLVDAWRETTASFVDNFD